MTDSVYPVATSLSSTCAVVYLKVYKFIPIELRNMHICS